MISCQLEIWVNSVKNFTLHTCQVMSIFYFCRRKLKASGNSRITLLCCHCPTNKGKNNLSINLFFFKPFPYFQHSALHSLFSRVRSIFGFFKMYVPNWKTTSRIEAPLNFYNALEQLLLCSLFWANIPKFPWTGWVLLGLSF